MIKETISYKWIKLYTIECYRGETADIGIYDERNNCSLLINSLLINGEFYLQDIPNNNLKVFLVDIDYDHLWKIIDHNNKLTEKERKRFWKNIWQPICIHWKAEINYENFYGEKL